MALPTVSKPTKRLTEQRRRYPRSNLRIKAAIIIEGGRKKDRALEAYLETRDISMSGVFFESTFFLKLGMKVRVEFSLPGDPRVVAANGTIVREERIMQAKGSPRTGFAVHFDEFVADSAVVLASLFLAPRVRGFIETYMRSRRDSQRSEGDKLVDAVVAWELAKADDDNMWWEE